MQFSQQRPEAKDYPRVIQLFTERRKQFNLIDQSVIKIILSMECCKHIGWVYKHNSREKGKNKLLNNWASSQLKRSYMLII